MILRWPSCATSYLPRGANIIAISGDNFAQCTTGTPPCCVIVLDAASPGHDVRIRVQAECDESMTYLQIKKCI